MHGGDNSLITSQPGSPRQVIVIYATGLGAVSPGHNRTAARRRSTGYHGATPIVTIGGANAGLLFSGLTPGLVGLYQINASVAQSAATGTVDLVVSVNGLAGKAVKIAVQ